MKKLQLFLTLAVAAVMFSSCGDEVTYPVTLTFEEATYGDITAYENSGGVATEIDAAAYENDADLVFQADEIPTSIRLLTETTAEFVDGTEATPSTYTKDGDTFTFVQTSTDTVAETFTLIAKGDEDELKFDSQVLKVSSANGSFDFTIGVACVISSIDGNFCGDPSDLFDTDDEDGLLAIIREAKTVFTTAE